MGEFKYKAFISYSHKDKKFATKLHSFLETYKIPSALLKDKKNKFNKLGKFFKDVDELPASHSLPDKIDKALEESEYLIIICSPFSAKSLWVNKEVKNFIQKSSPDKILPIIVDGIPNTNDYIECFPEELKKNGIEPGAPDITKSPIKKEFTRLIAGLLNIGFDELWKREKRRQRLNVIFKSILISIFFILSSFALIQYFSFQKEREKTIHTYLNHALESTKEKNWQDAEKYFKKANNLKPSIDANIGMTFSKQHKVPLIQSHKTPFNKVTKIAISNNNKLIAIGGSNGQIKILDVNKGKEISYFKSKKREGDVSSLVFSSDSKHIIYGTSLYRYKNGNLASNTAILKSCNIEIFSCKIIYKGDHSIKQIFTHSTSNNIFFVREIIEDKTGTYKLALFQYNLYNKIKEPKIILQGKGVMDKHFFWDKKSLIYTISYDEITIREVNTLKIVDIIKINHGINNLIVLDNGDVVISNNNNLIKVSKQNKKIYNFYSSHKSKINNLKLNSQNIIASSTDEGVLKLWNTNGKLLNTLHISKNKLKDIKFSSNGQFLSVVTQSDEVKIYSLNPIMNKKKSKNKIFLEQSNFTNFSPNYQYYIYKDKIIDKKNGQQIKVPFDLNNTVPVKVKFDKKSRKVAYHTYKLPTDNGNGDIVIYNFLTKTINNVSISHLKGDLNEFIIHPDKNIIILAFGRILYSLNYLENKIVKLPFTNSGKILKINFNNLGNGLYILTENGVYNFNLEQNKTIEVLGYGSSYSSGHLIYANYNQSIFENIFTLFESITNGLKLMYIYEKALNSKIVFKDYFKFVGTVIDKNIRIFAFDDKRYIQKIENIITFTDTKKIMLVNDDNSVVLFSSNSRPVPVDIKDKIRSSFLNNHLLITSHDKNINIWNNLTGEKILTLERNYSYVYLENNKLILYSDSFRRKEILNLSDKDLVSLNQESKKKFLPSKLDGAPSIEKIKIGKKFYNANIKSLDLTNEKRLKSLKGIEKFKQLKTLKINSKHLHDAKLVELDIRTLEVIGEVDKFPRIKNLINLFLSKSSQYDLKEILQNYKWLNTLYIDPTENKSKIINSTFETLRYESKNRVSKIMLPLFYMKKLISEKSIIFSWGIPIKIKDLSTVKNFFEQKLNTYSVIFIEGTLSNKLKMPTNLKYITIAENIVIKDYDIFSSLPNLEFIRINNTSIKNIKNIEKLKKLKRLDTDVQIPRSFNFPSSLETFTSTRIKENTYYDWKKFKHLKNLNTIDIKGKINNIEELIDIIKNSKSIKVVCAHNECFNNKKDIINHLTSLLQYN